MQALSPLRRVVCSCSKSMNAVLASFAGAFQRQEDACNV